MIMTALILQFRHLKMFLRNAFSFPLFCVSKKIKEFMLVGFFPLAYSHSKHYSWVFFVLGNSLV